MQMRAPFKVNFGDQLEPIDGTLQHLLWDAHRSRDAATNSERLEVRHLIYLRPKALDLIRLHQIELKFKKLILKVKSGRISTCHAPPVE